MTELLPYSLTIQLCSVLIHRLSLNVYTFSAESGANFNCNCNTELQKALGPSTEINANNSLQESNNVAPSPAFESNGDLLTSSRIALPVLESDLEQQYAIEASRPPVVWNCDERASDVPLELKSTVQQQIASRYINRYSNGCRRTARPLNIECCTPSKVGRFERTVSENLDFRCYLDESPADVKTHALPGKNALEALTAAYDDDDDDDNDSDDENS